MNKKSKRIGLYVSLDIPDCAKAPIGLMDGWKIRIKFSKFHLEKYCVSYSVLSDIWIRWIRAVWNIGGNNKLFCPAFFHRLSFLHLSFIDRNNTWGYLCDILLCWYVRQNCALMDRIILRPFQHGKKKTHVCPMAQWPWRCTMCDPWNLQRWPIPLEGWKELIHFFGN